MSIVLLLVALGAICVLLWNYAIYIVPISVGLWVGFQAVGWGAGIGSVLVGLFGAIAIYVAAQVLLARIRWIPIRLAVLSIFAVPAGVAAWYMAIEILEFGLVPSPAWRHIFAAIAAVIVGFTAWVRLRDGSRMRAHRAREAMPFQPTADINY
jgi:hypothetical protein